MNYLQDFFSCEELEAMAKEQQRIVDALTGEVDKAMAAAEVALEAYGATQDTYWTLVKSNAPQPMIQAWKTAKDAAFAARERAFADRDKAIAERDKARADQDAIDEARKNCRPKKKSGVVGAVLIGLGCGLAFLGWGVLHGPKIVTETDAEAIKGQVLAPPSVPPGFEPTPTTTTTTIKKKVKFDAPLGEDPPQLPPPPYQPPSDKSDVSDGSADIKTGDADATGNRSSTEDRHDVSDTGGQSSTGNDSQSNGDSWQRPEGERPHEERPHEERPSDR